MEDEVVDGRIRQGGFNAEDSQIDAQVERPKISFKDIGGMTKVKEEIQVKIIFPMTHAECMRLMGKRLVVAF